MMETNDGINDGIIDNHVKNVNIEEPNNSDIINAVNKYLVFHNVEKDIYLLVTSLDNDSLTDLHYHQIHYE